GAVGRAFLFCPGCFANLGNLHAEGDVAIELAAEGFVELDVFAQEAAETDALQRDAYTEEAETMNGAGRGDVLGRMMEACEDREKLMVRDEDASASEANVLAQVKRDGIAVFSGCWHGDIPAQTWLKCTAGWGGESIGEGAVASTLRSAEFGVNSR